jgi:hypothetical protein
VENKVIILPIGTYQEKKLESSLEEHPIDFQILNVWDNKE